MSSVYEMAIAVRELDSRSPLNLRLYPSVPAADHDVERFRRQCERDEQLRNRLRIELADERAYERGVFSP